MKYLIVTLISFVFVCFAQTQAQAMMVRPKGDRIEQIKETLADAIGVPNGDYIGYEDFGDDFNFTYGDYQRVCLVLTGDFQVDPDECEYAIHSGRLNNLKDVLQLTGD